ncbi:hypothetical protein BGW38_002907 [Lunasporangiospora selenospora]|uniref:Transmembrane protein 135 N-terminal domain-containing protein n=1 Tax=Lunasporangiospora selenospora TaxID=979761 RepID=A0A9P6G0P1_9FUNG|nr:hypothetical protein BGW38_002907 [Lunasporangiospora selenospora]
MPTVDHEPDQLDVAVNGTSMTASSSLSFLTANDGTELSHSTASTPSPPSSLSATPSPPSPAVSTRSSSATPNSPFGSIAPQPLKAQVEPTRKPKQGLRQPQLSPELKTALRVCIRSYGVGYVFATAPKLIRTLIGFLTNPRKAAGGAANGPQGRNIVLAFLSTLLSVIKEGTSAKKDGLSMLLMISLGGYKLLELFLTRGMVKAYLGQQRGKPQPQTQLRKVITTTKTTTVNGKITTTKSERTEIMTEEERAEAMLMTPEMRQKVTMLSSFVASAAAIMFMHRYRPNYATIDYSLFAVVRGLDVLGHVAVKKQWGPRWLGSYGAVAVFVLACTEIMFSFLYAPERLPGPYAFWITKMARMDKRLLETLRSVRAGKIEFQSTNPPEVANLLTGLCHDLKLDPKMGDFELRRRIPCELVHQGISKSCETHAAYRLIQGFLVSTGIYLPVHLLPALLSPKAFADKLQQYPLQTVTSTLLATARSSAFLGTYIALIWYGICSWRSKFVPLFMKATGRQYTSSTIDYIYGPLLGSFLCGFSVLIEKPHRRAEMALYVLPRAMYSMWSRVMSGRISRRAEMAGEALMYALSMSVLLTGIMWRREMVRPSMQGLLGWMLEIPKSKRASRRVDHVREKQGTHTNKQHTVPTADDKTTFAVGDGTTASD